MIEAPLTYAALQNTVKRSTKQGEMDHGAAVGQRGQDLGDVWIIYQTNELSFELP